MHFRIRSRKHPRKFTRELFKFFLPHTGWSSLETIHSASNDKNSVEKEKFSKTSNLLTDINCETNNPNCRICKQQSTIRRQRRSKKSVDLESDKTGYADMRVVPVGSDRLCSKSLPNELQFQPKVQELFTFIENVLSSWFVEDGAYTSQGESENDDKSKSFEQESDEDAENKRNDDDDIFQITIEKQKKEKRKQKKMDDKEFNEISFEFDYG